jgi:hypothetical protein
MIVDVAHAVNEFHLRQVTPGMNDNRDRLEALRTTQTIGDSGGQKMGAQIVRSQLGRFYKTEPN